MLSRLVAAAVLVALVCAIAVQAQQVPAAGGAPVCKLVDQDVVNVCFKSLGEGKEKATTGRKTEVNCCTAFGGHSCLCQMKTVWESKGNTRQNKVPCVKNKACP